MKKLQAKGFTLIEGLLVIIALTLIVGVGFYVFSANKDETDKNTQSTTASDTEKAASTAEKTTKYLAIKELGFKIPLTDSLKDATYELSPDGSSVSVSTPNFTNAVNNCSSDTRASGTPAMIGVISKQSGTYTQSTETSNVYADFSTQLDGFYLEVSNADGGLCSGTDNAKNKIAEDMFTKLSPDFRAAVKAAEKL